MSNKSDLNEAKNAQHIHQKLFERAALIKEKAKAKQENLVLNRDLECTFKPRVNKSRSRGRSASGDKNSSLNTTQVSTKKTAIQRSNYLYENYKEMEKNKQKLTEDSKFQ